MMKLSKKLCAFSVAAVMSLSVCAPAFAEEATADNTVDIQFNGQTAENSAVLVDGSTYVKAADVKTLFGVDCTVTDGKATLTVDGAAVNVDAQVVDGNFIPVRAITTALGYSLGWDDAEKTVVVVDVDKMIAESGQTFEIIGKYMDYALSIGDSYKTTSEFSGNVEVVDTTATMSLPFSGTTTGITNIKGQDLTVNLALDFTQIKEILEAQGLEDAEKATLDTIVKALESSETKFIYDVESNIFYMNSTMFTAFGLSADTWVSIDFSALVEMGMPESYDMKSVLELYMSGDINAYIAEMLKTSPVNTVSSYEDIVKAYDLIASMLGDKAFVLEDGQYKSSFAYSENGTEVTYSMTLGTDGDKVNSSTVAIKMAADGVTVDMNVASDKDYNSTMTLNMNILDMLKMNLAYKAAVEATTEAPQLTVPEGATVLSLNNLLTGMTTLTADGVEVPAVAVPETAAEATAEETTEVPAEESVEAPTEEVAEAPAEEVAEAPAEETTETTAETVDTPVEAETTTAA